MYINSGPSKGVAHYLAAGKVVVNVCICVFLDWEVGIYFAQPGWVNVKKQKGNNTESTVATYQTATHERVGIESLLLQSLPHEFMRGLFD